MIDNLGFHAVTISGDGEQIKLWHLYGHSPVEHTVESYAVGLTGPKFAVVITLRGENERLRTIVVVAGGGKLVVLDRTLGVMK